MMNVFDITELEDTIVRIVRDDLKVSGSVYSSRPKSAPQKPDYVVARVSGGVEDMGTYGECRVVFELFAKNANNSKNGRRLSVMYRALVEGLPSYTGRYEFDNHPNVIGDTEDDFGFNCRIVSIKTTIKII